MCRKSSVHVWHDAVGLHRLSRRVARRLYTQTQISLTKLSYRRWLGDSRATPRAVCGQINVLLVPCRVHVSWGTLFRFVRDVPSLRRTSALRASQRLYDAVHVSSKKPCDDTLKPCNVRDMLGTHPPHRVLLILGGMEVTARSFDLHKGLVHTTNAAHFAPTRL